MSDSELGFEHIAVEYKYLTVSPVNLVPQNPKPTVIGSDVFKEKKWGKWGRTVGYSEVRNFSKITPGTHAITHASRGKLYSVIFQSFKREETSPREAQKAVPAPSPRGLACAIPTRRTGSREITVRTRGSGAISRLARVRARCSRKVLVKKSVNITAQTHARV